MDKEMSVIIGLGGVLLFIFGLTTGTFMCNTQKSEPVVIVSENTVEIIEEVPVVKERIVPVEVIHEVTLPREPETRLTQDEKILMAKLIHAEAGTEDYIGKRLVADVILNRVGTGFGNSVTEVVYKPGQFTHPSTIYTEQDLAAVEAECYERLDYEIMYFKAGHFFSGHPRAYQHGGHYFSY